MKYRLIKLTSALLASLVSLSAYGAEVRRITKKAVIVTGATPEDGLSKGEEACFYDGDDTEVGCGTVVRTAKAGKIVYVKAERSVKKKLKKGFAVRGSSTTSGESAVVSANPLKVWMLYSAAFSTPATFTKLAYEAHANEAPATLWEKGDAVKDSLVGINLAVGIPVGSLSIIPGFRYRAFTTTLAASDLFVGSSPNRFVEVEQSATAMGFYTDVAYLNVKFGKSGDLFLTSGLDFDMSTVTFKSTQKDDSATPLPDEEFASAKSSLTLVGLRLGAAMDFIFAGAFGVNLGTNVIVPLAKVAGSFKGDVNDTSAPQLADQTKDLETALDHKKNSVGIELNLGMVLAF